MPLRGYNKTTILGTDACIIIPSRERYVRETTLPDNWTRIRIGAFLEHIGTADDNATTVAELVTRQNIYDDFCFGISNGVGIPGEAGNRFIGFTQYRSVQFGATYSKPNWNSGASPSGVGMVMASNGVTQTIVSLGGGTPLLHRDPAGTADFAAYLGLEIRLSGTQAFAMAHTPATTGLTNTSSLALRQYLVTNNFGSGITINTSWWNSSPVGLRHFFIRSPLYNNRLRIHSMEVMQLA